MNVDAALSPTKASIAVIARNSMGSIIKARAKEVPLLDPMVVKAMAIVWALELALSEKFAKVIVESDAKMCIEDLSYPTDTGYWKIRNFSIHTIDLISGFVSCNVHWVCRERNQVAHALAKAAFSLALPFCCSLDTFPPSVDKAWFRDDVMLTS